MMLRRPSDRDLGYARDNVFAKLALPEFGVGIADSKLTVYLTRPLKERKTRHIRKVAASAVGGREVKFFMWQSFNKE